MNNDDTDNDTAEITELLPSFPIDLLQWKVLPQAFILKQSSSVGKKNIMSRD